MKKTAFRFSVVLSTLVEFLAATMLFGGDKNLQVLSHFSLLLNKTQQLTVYLPDRPGKHSVVYLLHGAGGDYTDWVKRTDLKNIADRFDLIIVMPDGGNYSWYSDSPLIPESRYESYIVGELVPFIDSAFATYADRRGRGVCGLSMGGYGAMKFGLKYPRLFSSVSSMSGVLTIMHHPEGWSMPRIFGSQGEHPEAWRKEDLISILQSAKDSIVAIKFDTGLDDFALLDNREFLSALQKLHRTFEYGEFPGTHSWRYWGSHLEEHLEFHARNLIHSAK